MLKSVGTVGATHATESPFYSPSLRISIEAIGFHTRLPAQFLAPWRADFSRRFHVRPTAAIFYAICQIPFFHIPPTATGRSIKQAKGSIPMLMLKSIAKFKISRPCSVSSIHSCAIASILKLQLPLCHAYVSLNSEQNCNTEEIHVYEPVHPSASRFKSDRPISRVCGWIGPCTCALAASLRRERWQRTHGWTHASPAVAAGTVLPHGHGHACVPRSGKEH
jgi:hypothetical protein